MSVPGKRRARSAKGRRRSHHALRPAQLIACQQCKQPTRPHQVCPHCGTYQGRQVVVRKTKTKKKER